MATLQNSSGKPATADGGDVFFTIEEVLAPLVDHF